MLGKAPDASQALRRRSRVGIAALNAKHEGLIADLDRLAGMNARPTPVRSSTPCSKLSAGGLAEK